MVDCQEMDGAAYLGPVGHWVGGYPKMDVMEHSGICYRSVGDCQLMDESSMLCGC